MSVQLSIITVNLNNSNGLLKTIKSIIDQSFTSYEYIVIDGGSTDGSKEIIEKYSDKITYWVSEPDKGIYDGMNKGIRAAKGEYCLFLNSGDFLHNNKVLYNTTKYLHSHDIIYGNFIFTQNNSEIIKKPPVKITFEFLLYSSLPHCSSFIKRELLIIHGLYDAVNKIVSDWEFFFNAIIKYDAKTKYINEIISVFEGSGISNNIKYNSLMLSERKNIITNSFSDLILNDIASYRVVKNKYNTLKGNFFVRLLLKIGIINE